MHWACCRLFSRFSFLLKIIAIKLFDIRDYWFWLSFWVLYNRNAFSSLLDFLHSKTKNQFGVENPQKFVFRSNFWMYFLKRIYSVFCMLIFNQFNLNYNHFNRIKSQPCYCFCFNWFSWERHPSSFFNVISVLFRYAVDILYKYETGTMSTKRLVPSKCPSDGPCDWEVFQESMQTLVITDPKTACRPSDIVIQLNFTKC